MGFRPEQEALPRRLCPLGALLAVGVTLSGDGEV